MKVEEVALPGVGRKFTITVQSGDRLVIVVHNSGKRELQYFEFERVRLEVLLEIAVALTLRELLLNLLEAVVKVWYP